MWKALLVVTFFIAKGNTNDCVPRSFGTDRIVCVCNATYCDTTPDNNPKVPARGTFYWYVTSREGLRMKMTEGQVGSCGESPCTVTLNIDTTKRYQKIQGFGGAFTDSAGINIRKLSAATQDQLIRAYYDPNIGSRYTLGRVPIGGSDFSTRPYTYDDYDNDTRLEHFALQREDYDYKIPYMKRALELNPETKFLAVPWSPPTWMKTNNKINGFGFLKTEYYGLYTDYLLKFMDEYKKLGLDTWAVTTGNEPMDAFVPFELLNTMGWTPQTMGDWVAGYLGPALAKSQHKNVQIFALDDQRLSLPWFIRNLFQNTKAEKYITGTAVHWYTDSIIPPTVLDATHNSFPNKAILMTEACTGSGLLEYPKVILGSWDRGVSYILSIIEYMNHWTIGWIDWNLALDDSGGPNWIRNFVDSPIIVNQQTDEFYKNPMYYALMHFSRFVERNSVRVSISQADNIKSTAFVTPSHEVVVVLYNEANSTRVLSLKDVKRGPLCVTVPPNSMNTIVYRE